ncbi:hypothetical protein [Jatrophihabitans fulvus]
MIGAVVAFVAVLVIAGVALTLIFDSLTIAITPALVIAAIVGVAVYVMNSRRTSKPT